MQDSKVKRQRCVMWLREQLGLTQIQFGKLIGTSSGTVQSIELGRLPLDEPRAFSIESRTDISHRWLLDNDLSKPPVQPDGQPWGREAYEFAKKYSPTMPQLEAALLRMPLLRAYVVLRMVADELGYNGVNATGFGRILQTAVLECSGAITDKATRERAYAAASKITLDNEKTLAFLGKDIRALAGYLREYNESKRKSHERYLNESPEERERKRKGQEL